MAGLPVAIFSLEMSREEVVSRLLCSQGRIDSQRLRTGRLTEADFTRLSNAASVFYKKPVYVDDSPGLTVTEIRAKCRRLKRRPGLELVIVDYLQLMSSPGSQENRQQEIATISRNLKNLARELHVPVIAVSQLNRSLESREDKRPRLGDLRECLTADTPIRRSDIDGATSIGDIARQGLRNVPVWSVDPEGRLVPSLMKDAWSTGVKEIYRVATRSGRVVRATANHPLLTTEGWRQVGDLAPGVQIAVADDQGLADAVDTTAGSDAHAAAPDHGSVTAGVGAPPAASGLPGGSRIRMGYGDRLADGTAYGDGLVSDAGGVAVADRPIGAEPWRPVLTDEALCWDEIVSIEGHGWEETFDAEVLPHHNFIAGDICVHNSGAIEQDSDVVVFIYRHEYYHPEATETKGLAEVHVAKHRQGAIGKVDMTFLPEFTLFADLGRDTSVAL